MDGSSEETQTSCVVYGTKSFNEGELEVTRKKAHRLCSEYLNGAWRNVTLEQFVIKKVGGGLSNLLYYCALPAGVEPVGDEPTRALLRIYGESQNGENVMAAHFYECVVFTMLSENQRGPRLYGVFPGGRLEQYIPGRPLQTDELLDDDLSLLIADAFASIHSMNVPLSKEPTYIWNEMFRWIGQIEKYLEQEHKSENLAETTMVENLRQLDLKAEIRWLRQFLQHVRSPVVFCHNDLQEGNILLKNSSSGEKSIILIDFEYCAYNNRGFDLANHLCETMYDYTNEQFPYFWDKPGNYPSREKQARFVERYLCKFHKTDTVSVEEIEQVLDEIDAFVLASHMFWTVWSVVSACSSTICFDYWGYGEARLSAYKKHKQELLETRGDLVSCIGDAQVRSMEESSRSPSLIEIS